MNNSENNRENNGENSDDRQRIYKLFPTNCLVLVITSVWKIAYSSAIAPITAYLVEKTLLLTVL